MRRSARQTSMTAKAEKEREFWSKLKNDNEEGLEIFFAGHKGRGVKATKHFHQGDFVAKYKGELVSHKEAVRR